jgi:hypothetical protein
MKIVLRNYKYYDADFSLIGKIHFENLTCLTLYISIFWPVVIKIFQWVSWEKNFEIMLQKNEEFVKEHFQKLKLF